jgi:hypothetical protein
MFAAGKTDGAVSAVVNYIEDVFSTYLYTGNDSTQTITNGIDLSTKGGLVWIKNRNNTAFHGLFDTVRGAGKYIGSNTTAAQSGNTGDLLGSFNSDGFSVNTTYLGGTNETTNKSTFTYASWTFRKQPKFFDVVTWTGDGTSPRAISHNLGSAPGCVIIKQTNAANDWCVWHTATGNDKSAALNANTPFATFAQRIKSVTSTTFSVGNSSTVNDSGATYVAYLFAHDAGGFGTSGSENVISCGSFTTDGSGYGTTTLGYEPQFVLWKASSDYGNWNINDNMRGVTASSLTSGTEAAYLFPNASAAENGSYGISINATGFQNYFSPSTTYIYIAIRRGPMKVPTSGTSVFAPALGTSASTIPTFVTNFPVDLGFYHSRANTADWFLSSRLQGGGTLNTNTTLAEAAPDANYAFDSNTGWGKNFNSDKASSNFRRAPSFFDEVCYTGTGSAQALTHNLGAVPELMIVKQRTAGTGPSWFVYSVATGNTKYLVLNDTVAADIFSGIWNNTTPTSTQFTIGSYTSQSAQTYVAYLFATCAGVSKVGSYTGNGSTQTINCGFTGGARFVLLKRTDATGGWYVYDTARGMTTLTDPYLFLNSTAAETATLGSVTTVSTGFALDATILTAINASGGSYIFLAIA